MKKTLCKIVFLSAILIALLLGTFKDFQPTSFSFKYAFALDHAVNFDPAFNNFSLLKGPNDGETLDDNLRGPNDGEPLNNWIEFHFQTPYMGAGIILVYKDDEFLEPIWLQTNSFILGIREVIYRLDTTRFENGDLNLSFYLFAQEINQLYGPIESSGKIENPTMELPTLVGSIESMPVVIQGRAGDQYYMLEVGTRSHCMDQSPEDRMDCDFTTTMISTGWFKTVHDTDIPVKNIVINLDTLFSFYGFELSMSLWTLHPENGWARSAIHNPLSPPDEPILQGIQSLHSEQLNPLNVGFYNLFNF